MRISVIFIILFIFSACLSGGKGEVGGVLCIGFMGFPDSPDGLGLGFGPRVEYPIAGNWLRAGAEIHYFRLAPGFLIEFSDPANFHDIAVLTDLSFGKGKSMWTFGFGFHNMKRTYPDDAPDEYKQKETSWSKFGFHLGQSNRFYVANKITGVQDTRIVLVSLGEEEQSFYFNAQISFGVLFNAF
ncbi:MAG: hypothetical protein JXA60_12380 [Candidatus Coatesbacteria bacterium]|nr:hypothetical protein [Candidatus Coatesbacteria bacterium]